MKMRFALLSCIVLAIAALLATPALAQNKCTSLAGTIVGTWDPSVPNPYTGSTGAWVGWAYLTFGKDPTVFPASLVDLNNGYKDHPFRALPNGSASFAGNEILTFTVKDVGSFQMSGHFLCVAGSPTYCGFSEEGKLVPEAGTGEYAGMTGNISSHGMAAGIGTPEQPAYWVSQMTGSVCK